MAATSAVPTAPPPPRPPVWSSELLLEFTNPSLEHEFVMQIQLACRTYDILWAVAMLVVSAGLMVQFPLYRVNLRAGIFQAAYVLSWLAFPVTRLCLSARGYAQRRRSIQLGHYLFFCLAMFIMNKYAMIAGKVPCTAIHKQFAAMVLHPIVCLGRRLLFRDFLTVVILTSSGFWCVLLVGSRGLCHQAMPCGVPPAIAWPYNTLREFLQAIEVDSVRSDPYYTHRCPCGGVGFIAVAFLVCTNAVSVACMYYWERKRRDRFLQLKGLPARRLDTCAYLGECVRIGLLMFFVLVNLSLLWFPTAAEPRMGS